MKGGLVVPRSQSGCLEKDNSFICVGT